MSKTVLANVDGFTPCIDDMVAEYGIVTAAVFGRMWRHCQGKHGVCFATQTNIATDLHLSRQTVLTHIKLLVKDGYLEDRTPSLRNKPHTYADTGKASVSIKLTAGVKQIDSSVKEIDSDGQIDVHEDSSKKAIKKQKGKKARALKKRRAPDLVFEALTEASGNDIKKLTKQARGMLNRCAKELKEVDATPDQIARFPAWYRQNIIDNAPSIVGFSKYWPRYLKAVRPPEPPPLPPKIDGAVIPSDDQAERDAMYAAYEKPPDREPARNGKRPMTDAVTDLVRRTRGNT